ncbi:hypothetical protein [Frankia sp. QA3]|uniref:RCC1 domain-containing protein n=1 Tax=Frankia sp. QA3 TaxID=710111 RepID=UPI0018DED454|nr:hypothetical protein [Frankia sp. QA3]
MSRTQAPAAAAARLPALAGGDRTGYSLRSNGTVWAWGLGSFGQLGNGATADSSVPVQVSGLTRITAVAAGQDMAYVLRSDGTVWAWGRGLDGALGNGVNANSSVPVQVSNLTGVTAIAAGGFTGYALLGDGTVRAWGRGLAGALGNGGTANSSVPVTVTGLSGVTAIAAGDNLAAYALLGNGTVRAWGQGNFGALGNGGTADSSVPVTVTGLTGVAAIAAGNNTGYALLGVGTVRAWGQGGVGQLGNGGTANSSVPVTVTGLSGVAAIAAGLDTGYALLGNGTVRAWGRGNSGALGNATTTDSAVSVQVQLPALTGVTAIAAGTYTGYGLRSDGTLRAWGRNNYGQLGTGTLLDSAVPVQVSGLTGIAAITANAGAYAGYALRSDGTVWAWGNNYAGQLGDGTTTNRPTPVQISALSGSNQVSAITASGLTGYALRSDGAARAWGYNRAGQLGNGTTTNSPLPVTVSGLAGVSALAARADGASGYALRSDGTAWAWGYNRDGELGNNSIINSTVPVPVSTATGLSGVSAIAGGGRSGYALRSDGTAWAWGDNLYGQLGTNNTPTDSLVPVQVNGA